MNQPTHIAGFLVHATDAALPEVSRVAHRHRASVRDTGVRGKVAIALACESDALIAECIDELHAVRGVIAVSVTSHYMHDVREGMER